MFKNAPIAAALLGLALTTAPAFAAEKTKVRVEYTDLDLTTAEGQHTLERRLDIAARNACGMDQHTTGSRLPSPQARACYKQATARAQDVMATAIDNASEESRMGG
ncbi:UrcA family protein [Novosphingobium album (ex Hu et al. 2023)]|uniref:UrcA family protein n=1 Tax=Novosphingobium album (ex Hu et al. 2023) TaxID=2930093 RepID=A0ABT0B4D8_9SPHN|nr:UrcA family protein [Novosphingobium album (ex Hu et al. 2023)]MCJ2179888.1 UrcA family protein [Novosphingobium album (ex Hu et al. 2023)]